MVVAKYVMVALEMRGRVTDPSLQNVLFCLCKNGITYDMTTIHDVLEQRLVVTLRPIDTKPQFLIPCY